ncbi:MAG: WD40 repeat domain-containing protein [Actinomycetota bacterium]
MDRRGFLLAAAAAPFALRELPVVLVTADTEAHIVAVDLLTGLVRKRIPTRSGPRSIERVGASAVVAHTAVGEVSIVRGLAVRHVLAGFVEPRYTASARDGRHAFVTDSGNAELVTVDVTRGAVVARLKLRLWPRHLSLSRDGRTLWVGLGTASPELAVVDVSNPRRPYVRGRVRPPFPAHDVGFSPSGRVWVTAGEARSIAVYDGAEARPLAADAAPQHVTFLGSRAFVTSGDDGTLRVYDEPSARLLHTTRVPVGSYNVQYAAGRIVTPSLARGTLCVLDDRGRLREQRTVAASSHDACLAGS